MGCEFLMEYEAPKVEVIEVQVEAGFANSTNVINDWNPTSGTYGS